MALVALLTPFDQAAEARQPYPFACDGGGVVTRGNWTVMPIPSFPDGAGGRQVRHHAVAPDAPGTIVVTNGTSVLRTTDGGCSWAAVFDLSTSPTAAGVAFSRDTSQIVDVTIPRHHGDRIYLVVMEVGRAGEGLPVGEGATPVIPHIVASFDGGATWGTYDSGLQPIARDAGDGASGYCGQISGCMLEFSPADPEVGYLALSVSDGAPGVLYATGSGARDGWDARSVPANAADPEPSQGIEQLALDPVDPARVWIDSGGLAVSDDGGTSWTPVDDGTDGFRVALDVAPDRGRSRTLVLASGQRTVPAPVDHMAVSTADGAFQAIDGALGLEGVRIGSADHAGDTATLVVAGPDGVYAFADRTFVRVDEPLVESYGPPRDVQGVARTEAYTMLGTGTVLIYHPTEPPAPPAPELPPFEVPPPPEPRPISLSPHGALVEVDPGATAAVDYELDLPAQPLPVDVFFLLDTSTTMEPLIEGLVEGLDGLVRGLVGAQLDVRFGLAEFQDSRDTGGIRYRLRHQLSRPSVEFQRSLASITTIGGYEPHLTALDQMVTGSGIADPYWGEPVEPGMQAAWRPGSLRVAVLGSNEPYGQPPDYDRWCYPRNNYEDAQAPPERTVMQRLRDHEVRLVGIEYIYDPREDPNRGDDLDAELCAATRPSGPSPLRAQLDRWTAATGAIAPRGGIDCDSDGEIDLHEDDPLACSLPLDQASGVVELSDALVRLILAVEQPRPVAVTAASGDGAIVSVDPVADFSAVDVRSDHRLGFTATFSCAAEQAGRKLATTLTATVAGQVVAQTPATVACGPQPAEDVPPPEIPQPGAPAAPAPAAPPALAGPAPAPAPVAAPGAAQAQAAATGSAAAAAPVAAPGLAPGGAVVDAGPAEARVRLAHNQAQDQARARRARILLASAHGQEDEPLPIITWGAAALLFGAAVTIVRRRDRRAARIR